MKNYWIGVKNKMKKRINYKKNIDWKNILTRSLWTFLQGFIGAAIITGFTKDELKVTLIGAIAGGLSALKTFITELLKKEMYVYDYSIKQRL